MKAILAACILCTAVAFAQVRPCSQYPLREPVRQFEARQTDVFEALLKLGHETGVSMSLHGWSLDLFDTRVDMEVRDSTIGTVLAAILEPLKDAEISQDRGVVAIRLQNIPTPGWMEYEVTGFTGRRGRLQGASRGLSMHVRMIENPAITGFAGHSRPGDANDLVGPFVDDPTTVRHVLNRMVCTSSEGALWVSHQTPRAEFFVSYMGQSYWSVLGYSEGLEVNLRVAELLRKQLRRRKARAK